MRTGLDRLETLPSLVRELASGRVGLLAHPASVDRDLVHVVQVLARLGIKPRVLFGPEHGYGGAAQDMISVDAAFDADASARVVSLYGDRFEDLSPKDGDLADLDVLVIDLADVGSRYYTFVWTALLAARAAAKRGVRVVVLDRPNPLGGERIEGRCQDAGFLSFVGLEPVPVRHAMTLGELVAYFFHRDGASPGRDGALTVVGVDGCDRSSLASAWDRPFVMTSPNMPTFETALVYPGGCLIEGTNLSEGRGTTRPFELVGAPFIDGARLARELTATGLPGFVARPVTIQTTFHKHAGALSGGVQIHPTDASTFRPYATYLALVALVKQASPAKFRFRTERYEYVDDIPAFDLLTGSARARTAIEQELPLSDWLDEVSAPEPGWSEVVAEAASLAARAAAR